MFDVHLFQKKGVEAHAFSPQQQILFFFVGVGCVASTLFDKPVRESI